MARSHLTLAALATSAVPGLDIVQARAHGSSGRSPGTHGAYDSAVLLDRDGRSLIIRVPLSQAAETEQSADLVALRALVPLGLEGAIVGKALYAGAFSLGEALDVAGV